MKTQILIYLFLFICLPFLLFAQDFSNKGKDFWIGYGNHVRMFNSNGYNAPPEKMQLYITSDNNTSGKVEISSIGFSQDFTINANQITTIDIPREAALMNHGLYDHGIHVTAQKPVVVYSFIYVNAVSGATVCLPTETLGREYFSVNFTQVSNEQNAHSYFFVIAADTGTTTVEIIPSGLTKAGQPAGLPFTVHLKQGQIYQVLGSNSGQKGVDLTGSKIRSIPNTSSGCKKIAVFSGAGKIKIGEDCNNTSDNLYQQMYPKATWGKKYIAVPGLVNTKNYFRICKSDPGSNVWVNGKLIPSSNFTNNFYYEILTKAVSVIESDKPILVAQYFTTQNCEDNPMPGDPEMIYLNPVEQTISQVTLNSMQPSTGTNIKEHYLNIVVKNNMEAIRSFKIDGAVYQGFTPVPHDPNYAYARLPVRSGTHNITCDTGFNIISYGFGDAESYGYSGGTNLKDLYQFVSIKNQFATVDFPAGCRNSPFYFSMVLPFKPTQMLWKFNGAFPDTLINSPDHDSSWVINGRRLYRYKIDKPYIIHEIGSYPIRIVAQNPTTEGCSGVQEIDYVLEIFDKPKAEMSISYSGCLPDSIYFSDNSSLDRQTIKRFWSFGDGQSSQIKSPAYKYNDTGKYVAYYNLITDIGCLSDTATKVIDVNPSPIAKFSLEAPFCQEKDIRFNDQSSISKGNIKRWLWKLGNNDTIARDDNSSFAYQYKTIGEYTVSLQIESDMGCLSKQETSRVNVRANPKAGFAMPGSCIADPFSQFTDTSKIEDGSESGFTYLWHFGDQNATNLNPNISTLRHPKHKYQKTGNYPVTLIVKTNTGCADTLQQVFTVNGALPKASVLFDDLLSFCSNKDVLLKNNSSVDFGNIVKLDIYWDYSNDTDSKSVHLFPVKGYTYNHKYPDFYTPENKTLKVHVIAYSGERCYDETTQTIELKSIPQLVFDPIDPVCANADPFMITQARNMGILRGIGYYSGTGVSSSGSYNPKVAVKEVDTLQFTFNADNGCSNQTKSTIHVYPVPVSNAGPDVSVLEGKSVTLQGSGTGRGIQYLWTPDFALSSKDSAKTIASPINDQHYTLAVRSADGCIHKDVVFVKVLKKPVIPNAFSPNGDGIHDLWEIRFMDQYPEASVEIYNRYGQYVYKSAGYYKPWDGRSNGNPLPIGTYYYLIKPKRGREQMSGFVDIIR